MKDYKDNPNSNNLKKLAKKYKVKVDRNELKKINVAKGSVDTYAEMLEFQNEMMDDPENMFNLKIDSKKYPNLNKFFEDAKAIADAGEEYILNIADSSVLIPSILTIANALVGTPYSEMIGRIDCGYYGNYKPWGQAPLIQWNFSNKKNLFDIISSWGYRTTESYARISPGSVTRPQTYNWWNCGFNTFRDDGIWNIQDDKWVTLYPNTYQNLPYYFREQNYNGWNPSGEPNPNIFKPDVGPWPYYDWGAYVYYYHKIFDNRQVIQTYFVK